MKNKNLLKHLLIGGVVGLGVGGFVFLSVNYLYGYHANRFLNIVVILSTILFYISAPVLGFFSHYSQDFQSVILMLIWVLLGALCGLIVGLISKARSSKK